MQPHSNRCRGGMPPAAVAAGLAALALLRPLPAQQPPADPAAEWQQLQARLSARPAPDLAARIDALQGFLQRHGGRGGSALLARLALGRCWLERFDGAAARGEFAAVLAAAGEREFDLRGRALYGLAQAEELLGNVPAAIERLQELHRTLDGSRYADHARVALNRLLQQRRLEIGKPLPQLQLGSDLQGRPLGMADLRGKPVLLVFFSLQHEASVRQLDQLAAVWAEHHLPEQGVVAFALEADTAALQALAQQHGWRFPVLAGDHRFLQQDWLQLCVTGTPSNFVVGRDGTLLLRDITPQRLQAALKAAR